MGGETVICPLAEALGKMLIMCAPEIQRRIDERLAKETSAGTHYRVYAVLPNGGQGLLAVSPTPEAGALPSYGPGGTLKTNAPVANDDAANKGYVDTNVKTAKDAADAAKDAADAALTLAKTKADSPVKELSSPDGLEVYIVRDGVVTKIVKRPDIWELAGNSGNLVPEPTNSYPPLPWTQLSLADWRAAVGISGQWLRFGTGAAQITVSPQWSSGQIWLTFGGSDGSHGGVKLGQQFNGGSLNLSYTNDLGLNTDGTLTIDTNISQTDYPLPTQAQLDMLKGMAGALDGKLDKTTQGVGVVHQIYAVTPAGQQTMLFANAAESGNTVPIRDISGRVEVGTPTAPNHAATKGFVEGLVPKIIIAADSAEAATASAQNPDAVVFFPEEA